MDAVLLLALIAMIMSVMTIVLSYMSWSGSARSFRYSFIAIMVSISLINWSYLLDISSLTLGEKLLWNDFEYMGYLGTLMFFFVFAMQFSGNKHATKRNIGILTLTSVIFVIIIAMNDYHHLYYSSVKFPKDELYSFDAVYGPLFYALAAYMILMAALSVSVLVKHYFSTPRSNRSSVGLVMFSGIISLGTVITNFALFNYMPCGLIIATGLMAGCIPLFIGAFWFELFEFLPFANEKVMDTMQDSAIVLDEKDRVLFMNKSAERFFERELGKVHGKGVSEALPMFPVEMLHITGTSDKIERPVLEMKNGYFELDYSRIKDHAGTPTGKLILLRDITQRRNAEEDARTTHEKLDLLNSITRHDIRNQLIILEARLSLLKANISDPNLDKHVDSGLRAVMNIDRQISSAKDYQDLGIRAPAWQSLDDVFKGVMQMLDLSNVSISMDTKGVEVLADPLLQKVFYNLIDNSIAHGGKISSISLKDFEVDDRLEIVYEDNGVGVPSDSKNTIFKMGVGHNTGLGLYLSREILRTDGMDIVEDGVEGKGARFRITVPKGNYRFPGRDKDEK
jgi:PAS domain S-box-containing protein